MPKLGADGKTPPVRYNGGVIYGGGFTGQFWRVLVNGDRKNEKRVKWGQATPTKASWLAAIKLIDDAH